MKNGEILGHKFHISAAWRFVVPELDITTDSYEQLREAVERRHKADKATNRAKLFIPAMWLDDKREIVEGVITGIHAGHGNIITKPILPKYHRHIYPRIDWLKMALAELSQHELCAAHICKVLKAFEVQGWTGYSFDQSAHAGEVDRIARDMELAKTVAEKTDLASQLKSTKRPKASDL